MVSKIEELLQESVKEIENRKSSLLKECEEIQIIIKNKEDDANKRISQLESASAEYISKLNKEAEAKLDQAEKIIKSLEGSNEKLESVSNELKKLDIERASFENDKKSFESYKASVNQKLEEKSKSLELRESKLVEANA